MEDLGVGLQLREARQLLAGTGAEQGRAALQGQLAAQLRLIAQPGFRRRCLQIAAELRAQPDGLQVAAQHVLGEIASCRAASLKGSAAVAFADEMPPPAGADTACSQSAGAAAQPLAEAQLCELTPGFSVYTSCPDEARFIHDEVFAQRCYLRHGITIGAGDTVIDCGMCDVLSARTSLMKVQQRHCR